MRRLLALAALVATPAAADTYGPPDWQDWEKAFVVASAADLGTTVYCIERHKCSEANPILGRHPSTGELVAFKVAGVALQYKLVSKIAESDPEAAKWVAIVSTILTAGVATANLRFVF